MTADDEDIAFRTGTVATLTDPLLFERGDCNRNPEKA
jgi:hypothetical protein